ncbi:MAG: hypothetical protein RBS56_03095 [Candidatus Gracilibacteria bacterium]|jgi:hypothetical protein|nr:hypothetical protein [Candidatus Gracilibacteria bacterium]
MKKFIFVFVLMISIGLTSCSFFNEDPIPESLTYNMGDTVLVVVPDLENEVLDFSLTQAGNTVTAQVGDENFAKFLKLCEIFRNMSENPPIKEFSVIMKYRNCADRFISFSNGEESPEISEIRAFYDEIVFLASADVE